MKCGRLCVNGKAATAFKAIYCLLAFAAIIVIYLNGMKTEWMFTHEMPMCIGLIISMWIVPMIANAFFFKMSPAIRIDYRQ